MKRLLLLLFLLPLLLLVACGEESKKESKEVRKPTEASSSETDVEEVADEDIEEDTEEVEVIELTPREEMIQKLVDLFDEGVAFDTGDYAKGDIPKGEYAFVSFDNNGGYYSEVDASGSIIDNANFDSFGYVQVHEAGEVETRGVLVHLEALDILEVTGAKDLYEIINEIEDYTDGGWYKVGMDIEPGEYTLESYGSGYVAIMSGPVGDSDIISNERFEEEHTVNVSGDDYLEFSRATIQE